MAGRLPGWVWILPVLGLIVLAGCRGTTSPSPPIHINPNMDWQERFDPQAANPMYADGRAMRPLVAGTVARGFLREDVRFYFGRDEAGNFVTSMPVPATAELLERGQERYQIFCSPCHGDAGDGQGIVTTGNYGYVPAPTYHTDNARNQPDGYFYDAIVNGIRSMPGYGRQIPVADRWAIVAYIRALQRSQNADAADVPASVIASDGQ
ncbi:MAG: cytochrome c [Rhodothermia bacterium]|nr:cytochrome c [Rhodothermia bacterium]